ncbi:hypothetical protein [Halomonas sp. M4R1S46]|uniref:hypothetical protein n=1 Tax=Halomonas sp. M4R1S46 TaxID=2982692 RepID=UPI0021E42C26|nr:hypothetical protein [Halomonas sp. M4R1S46]UYG06063.1 hypothetical protein OCT48_10415 [Halomonas sp. M4R1S46]
MSTGFIFLTFYVFTLLVGYLGFNVFTFSYGMPFELGDDLYRKSFVNAEFVFFIAIVSFMLGDSISGLVFRKSSIQESITQKQASVFLKAGAGQKKILFPLLLLSWSMLVLSYGLDAILYRSKYIPANIGAIKSLGLLLTVLLLVLIYGVVKSKLCMFFIYSATFLIFFSYGSRFMAVVPICYIMSNLLFSNKNLGPTKIISCAASSLFFVMLAIQLRRFEPHGLVPYFWGLINRGIDIDLWMFSINYIASFSYSLTAYVVEKFSYDIEYFYLSINPALGSMLDWADRSKDVRVNEYVPFNAISELYLTGVAYLSVYFLFSGFYWKLIDQVVFSKSKLCAVFVYVFCLIFTFYTLQYNLRSSTRIMYYSFAVISMYFSYFYIIRILPKKKNHG